MVDVMLSSFVGQLNTMKYTMPKLNIVVCPRKIHFELSHAGLM